eukprot:15136018-Alexandrium_andersonii.AAC.1
MSTFEISTKDGAERTPSAASWTEFEAVWGACSSSFAFFKYSHALRGAECGLRLIPASVRGD